MTSFADFDRYCEENAIPPERYGEAFADWLAQETGKPIIGGPTGEAPSVVKALPDEAD